MDEGSSLGDGFRDGRMIRGISEMELKWHCE